MRRYIKAPYGPKSAPDALLVPPERLTSAMVNQAIALAAGLDAERVIQEMIFVLPGHDESSFAIKLAAISSFSNAKVRNPLDVARVALEWAEYEFEGKFEDLVRRGNIHRATEMMAYVKSASRGCQSGLSKYLAYHAPDRWSIYDSWVRHYLWAHALHIDRTLRPQPGWATVTRFRETEDYSNYVALLEAVWRKLRLPTTATPRERDSALWYRASKCGITRPCSALPVHGLIAFGQRLREPAT